jgi:hypothetical protein
VIGLVEVAAQLAPIRVGKQNVTLYIDARPAGAHEARLETITLLHDAILSFACYLIFPTAPLIDAAAMLAKVKS